jgi:hypothetical protein
MQTQNDNVCVSQHTEDVYCDLYSKYHSEEPCNGVAWYLSKDDVQLSAANESADEVNSQVFRKYLHSGESVMDHQEEISTASNAAIRLVVLAAEAAAAKVAGYESWAAFQTARAQDKIDYART